MVPMCRMRTRGCRVLLDGHHKHRVLGGWWWWFRPAGWRSLNIHTMILHDELPCTDE